MGLTRQRRLRLRLRLRLRQLRVRRGGDEDLDDLLHLDDLLDDSLARLISLRLRLSRGRLDRIGLRRNLVLHLVRGRVKVRVKVRGRGRGRGRG